MLSYESDKIEQRTKELRRDHRFGLYFELAFNRRDALAPALALLLFIVLFV